MPKINFALFSIRAGVSSVLLCGLLSACAVDATPSPAVSPADPELLARGERLFNLHCMACHAVNAEGRTAAGPHLEGIFGRQIATQHSWDYPAHVADFDFVWTQATMRQWLVTPQQMVNNMCLPFRGLRRDSDVEALMAYLLEAT